MSSVISTTADELLHSQLYETLKKMVANAVSELKKSATDHERPSEEELQAAVPISVLPPDDDGPEIIRMLEEKNKIRQPRLATIPVGEMSIGFEVPANLPIHRIDVEKLVPPGTETTGTTTGGMRKFSFYERLKGWKIEVRQRQNGAVDSYFHHEKLKAALRSVTEVIGFMLYEDPKAVKSHKRKAASLLKEESSNKRVEVEMKPEEIEDFIVHDGNEVPTDDIPMCKD
ncbi:hypothetical protein M0R45_030321 [Rubus argutus]|uniref:Uncharacterized protein n=1 Tax=Rubus argutus TaxID=59490 RepID=A0AAW1WER2_RUBAR